MRSSSPRTHLALFQVQMRNQKWRRPALLGCQRLAFELIRDPRPPAGQIFEREIGSCNRRRTHARTNITSVSSPARSVSTETPLHVVSSFDQAVTQWMSTVGDSAESARNSCQVQLIGRSIAPLI
jgi:hypothetical protein